MSSVGRQQSEKKNGKSFDFKWFQRSSKPPPLTLLKVGDSPTSDRKKSSHSSSRSTSIGSGLNISTSRMRSSSTRSNLGAPRSFSDTPPVPSAVVVPAETPETVPFPTRQPRVSTSSKSSRDSSEHPRERSRSNSRDHARLFVQETQNFLHWRRKTDDSHRSRSSSITPSVRRPSDVFIDAEETTSKPTSLRERSLSATPSLSSSVEPVWLRRILPLPPPPTIGLGTVLEDPDVQKLQLDPMAVRYADHMHFLGYTHNRYVCAMLAEESGPKVDRNYNLMVMQAFVMRMLRFHGEPLDMSLRKFLFRVALPQEAQQIERVLHCFSILWNYHNPGLFLDDDQVLTVTYSLVMLHTDQFNRNVKRKIGKVDFVRNATLDGIAPEIFEYFYDNITSVPFRADEDVPSQVSAVHFEPPITPHGQVTLSPPVGASPFSMSNINVSPSSAKRRSRTSHASSNEGDETAVQDLTLSVCPASPVESEDQLISAPIESTKFTTLSSSALSQGLNVHLPPPPPPPPPTSSIATEDSGSLSSRRSSSFTWLRDHQLDPYPYLLENRLDALRPELSGVPDFSDIDTKEITRAEDFRNLQTQLGNMSTLQIVLPKSRPEVYMKGTEDQMQEAQTRPGTVSVEILKYGTLLRREWKRTFAGQRAGWREWGVLLTKTRLYLFKNSSFVRQMAVNEERGHEETFMSIDALQTATVLPMQEVTAVVVDNINSDENVFLFMLVEGGSRTPSQHFLAVSTEEELKEWVRLINAVATQATLKVSIQPLSSTNEIMRALLRIAEDVEVVEAKIQRLISTLNHFELLAPIHHRTRESLVFKAGGYSSKCEDAFTELTQLRTYENVLKYALQSSMA